MLAGRRALRLRSRHLSVRQGQRPLFHRFQCDFLREQYVTDYESSFWLQNTTARRCGRPHQALECSCPSRTLCDNASPYRSRPRRSYHLYPIAPSAQASAKIGGARFHAVQSVDVVLCANVRGGRSRTPAILPASRRSGRKNRPGESSTNQPRERGLAGARIKQADQFGLPETCLLCRGETSVCQFLKAFPGICHCRLIADIKVMRGITCA
jgi:hypothetical protein